MSQNLDVFIKSLQAVIQSAEQSKLLSFTDMQSLYGILRRLSRKARKIDDQAQ